MKIYKLNFSQLFKFYKLKSGYKTFSQLAHKLESKGFKYDLSLFSHWQRGSRVPKNRELLLLLIEIFAKSGAMKFQEQADTLLQSANNKKLNNAELKMLPLLLKISTPRSLEIELENFIEHEEICKKAKQINLTTNQILHKFSFVISTNTFLYLSKASKENYSSKANFLRKLIEDHQNSNLKKSLLN